MQGDIELDKIPTEFYSGVKESCGGADNGLRGGCCFRLPYLRRILVEGYKLSANRREITLRQKI